MVSSPLLEDFTISLLNEEKIPLFLAKDPISRYNFVVEAYNKDCNLIENRRLTPMQNCALYKWSFSLLNNFFGEILLIIIMIFLPGVNLLTFCLIFWSFLYYVKFLELFKSNEKLVPDLFKNMVYSPEMCESLHKINWFFEIEFKDLQGLTLNLDTIEFLSSRNKDGKVSFMIYNNVFWNFYYDVIQKRNLHLMWLLFSVALLILSGSVIFLYYYLITNQ